MLFVTFGPICVQLPPWSVDRNTPTPLWFSNAVLFSPVPTQIDWSEGSIAIAPIAIEAAV